MTRTNFTEVNLHFYMHRVHDFEVISYVKAKKQSRSLNSLLLRLLKRHILEEKENLINDLLDKKEKLGFLPDLPDSGFVTRDFIDLQEIEKAFLKVQSELDSLKSCFPK